MSEDRLLQATCEAVVMAVAQAVDAEPPERLMSLRLPNGPVVGKQMVIDATEKGGLLNMCRLAMLDADKAPASEVARIEYEHDKQGKFEVRRVYSIQSVRRRDGKLVLLENFLAERPEDVREEDFRPIESETYAQNTILKTLNDWVKYRAWQLQEQRHKA